MRLPAPPLAADPLTPDGGCRAIDGGWESFNRGGLNATGYPTQPGGWDFRNLTSFYHSQGLKLGMCASPDRCADRPPLTSLSSRCDGGL